MVEECRDWNPIPDEANRFHNVEMMHLEDSSTGDAPGLSLIVASYYPGDADNPEQWKPGAWRITFTMYLSYRMRPLRRTGDPPLTSPDDQKATWELFPSAYLVESGAQDGFAGGPTGHRVHHFVIRTGSDVGYEVIAAKWRCERVSDEWSYR